MIFRIRRRDRSSIMSSTYANLNTMTTSWIVVPFTGRRVVQGTNSRDSTIYVRFNMGVHLISQYNLLMVSGTSSYYYQYYSTMEEGNRITSITRLQIVRIRVLRWSNKGKAQPFHPGDFSPWNSSNVSLTSRQLNERRVRSRIRTRPFVKEVGVVIREVPMISTRVGIRANHSPFQAFLFYRRAESRHSSGVSKGKEMNSSF